VSDCGLEVSGFCFRIAGFRIEVAGFGLQVSGFGFRVSGFSFHIAGFGPKASSWVLGLPFQFAGFGFEVSDCGIRCEGRARGTLSAVLPTQQPPVPFSPGFPGQMRPLGGVRGLCSTESRF
jgi:hypothetical protein